MNGIIVINKPKGLTSNDVVQKIRKVLNIKQVGHCGTLDPMATGVLPIMIGQATKIAKYLIEHDKTYIATIKLGEKTETGDCEGKIIERKAIGKIEEKQIQDVLEFFLGKTTQIPPMYSAIKVNGKKLYEYAREGIKIDVEPRTIKIYEIELINYCNDEIKFRVNCSKGTYIRSLCEDIAEKLGTVRVYERTQKNKC